MNGRSISDWLTDEKFNADIIQLIKNRDQLLEMERLYFPHDIYEMYRQIPMDVYEQIISSFPDSAFYMLLCFEMIASKVVQDVDEFKRTFLEQPEGELPSGAPCEPL